MNHPVQFGTVVCSSIRATQRTEWVFLEVTDSEGITEVVEITCGDDSYRAIEFLSEMLSGLRGRTVTNEADIVTTLQLETERLHHDRALAAAISALRSAILGLQARHDGITLMEGLGGVLKENIPLYANINRSLLGERRTAKDFASAAERAVGEGFEIIKCAPFDEVRPPIDIKDILDLARTGLERVSAVRSVVGPNVEVLVDCHSRFEIPTAKAIAEELAKLDVGWFEEPLEPGEDPEGLAEIARSVSMPVAGGESGYGEDFYVNLMARQAVRVIMPDIKFCGGAGEAYRAGLAANAVGCRVSLHSPSGPVSQLASAQVTAAIPNAMALEHAVYEADWRAELMEPPERIEKGKFWFPEGKGVGARLNARAVQERGVKRSI